MAIKFPSQDYMDTLKTILNSEPDYARIARKWEGDLAIAIEPGGPLHEPTLLYWDLWHGTCRDSRMLPGLDGLSPAFVLTISYEDVLKVIRGTLDPIQALMTRRMKVRGSMGYMMRNVPTVLEFVRCARLIPIETAP